MQTNALHQLKGGQGKFMQSKAALKALKPESEGKEVSVHRAGRRKWLIPVRVLLGSEPLNRRKQVMVPMTSSLYMPGTLQSESKVILDIGTGYYLVRIKKTESRILGSVIYLTPTIYCSAPRSGFSPS